jgi:hypothetical protein
MRCEVCRSVCGKLKARNTSMAQPFGDEGCTAAILEFLAMTEMGTRGRQRVECMGEDDPEGGSESQSEGGEG